MTTENSEPKNLWKPGVSGNPSGKPRGTKSKSTQLVQALISRDPKALRDVVDVTIAAARNGKPWAVQLILDRLWPVPKGRTVTFEMDDIASVEDIGRAACARVDERQYRGAKARGHHRHPQHVAAGREGEGIERSDHRNATHSAGWAKRATGL